MDLWSEDAGKVKVFLISGTYPNNTEYGVIVDVAAGETGAWKTVEIPLTDFVGVDLSDVTQMKFDTQPNAGGVGVGNTGLSTFYVDNMSFAAPAPVLWPTRSCTRLRRWMVMTSMCM